MQIISVGNTVRKQILYKIWNSKPSHKNRIHVPHPTTNKKLSSLFSFPPFLFPDFPHSQSGTIHQTGTQSLTFIHTPIPQSENTSTLSLLILFIKHELLLFSATKKINVQTFKIKPTNCIFGLPSTPRTQPYHQFQKWLSFDSQTRKVRLGELWSAKFQAKSQHFRTRGSCYITL